MSARFLPLVALVALAGCAEMTPAAPPRVASTVYAFDQQGKARLCNVSAPAEPAAGSSSEGKITVGNDGGWCGIPVNRPGPEPFAAGLVTKRAQHGNVTIHTVGDLTRLDYRPDTGFSGEDSFALRLVPGNATLQVAVTVQVVEPPPTAAVIAPPPPAARPVPTHSPAPARRRTARPAS
jgi:hypothetical protein